MQRLYPYFLWWWLNQKEVLHTQYEAKILYFCPWDELLRHCYLLDKFLSYTVIEVSRVVCIYLGIFAKLEYILFKYIHF
jgi:hypothetical protein